MRGCREDPRLDVGAALVLKMEAVEELARESWSSSWVPKLSTAVLNLGISPSEVTGDPGFASFPLSFLESVFFLCLVAELRGMGRVLRFFPLPPPLPREPRGLPRPLPTGMTGGGTPRPLSNVMPPSEEESALKDGGSSARFFMAKELRATPRRRLWVSFVPHPEA